MCMLLNYLERFLQGVLQTHNMTSSQLVDSSVGRELHWHCRGHGFKSRPSPNFFQAFFLQLLSCVNKCEGLSSI